jgi:transcriptional regulator with XRE-family HTH domain
MTTTELFGTRLRALRKTAKLTQEILAKRAGVTPSYISKLETGHLAHTPSISTLRKLSAGLGVDELDLISAANKLGTPFPVLAREPAALEFLKEATRRAKTSAEWERLTELISS